MESKIRQRARSSRRLPNERCGAPRRSPPLCPRECVPGWRSLVLNLPSAAASEFVAHLHTAQQTGQLFAERGWCRVAGFQTRNPIHRAHEYIQKTALEIVDGLLQHPLVGETKPRRHSSRRAHGIIRSTARVLLSGKSHAAGRIRGSDALCRSARGGVPCASAQELWLCTHFIVGRDHPDVGNYYDTYAAQHIFDEFPPEAIGIIPLFFEHTFYCRKCQSIVSAKTCAHSSEEHLSLSGTQVRRMLENGQPLPIDGLQHHNHDNKRQRNRRALDLPEWRPERLHSESIQGTTT